MKKINLNDFVKVKLTPEGASIYYHQNDEINELLKKNNCNNILEPKMPTIDKDGYTEIQLWHLLQLFGSSVMMCSELPFGVSIYIKDDDIEDVEE